MYHLACTAHQEWTPPDSTTGSVLSTGARQDIPYDCDSVTGLAGDAYAALVTDNFDVIMEIETIRIR